MVVEILMRKFVQSQLTCGCHMGHGVRGRRQWSIIISVWLPIISLNLLGFTSGTNNAGAETNKQYMEYWYKTEQLCPDLQEAGVTGKDLDTANMPYKSVFRFIEQMPTVSESLCFLEANSGQQSTVVTALIQAIHVDNRPWNFSGSHKCEDHIKLKLPEPSFLKRSNLPKVICAIPKSKNGFKEPVGSMYHPFIWQFQKGKLGLSFSSFNLSHVERHNGSGAMGGNISHSEHEQSQPHVGVGDSRYWEQPDENGNQFVQIVFTAYYGRTCSVRVQQYLIDTQKTLCSSAKSFGLCGIYHCSEKESILRSLGFWHHQKKHEELDILLQAEIRREDQTYLEILVSTLRALIMPLLFLSVFYVTRRLRLKLASHQVNRLRHRNVLRSMRSLLREGNNREGTESSDMLRPSLILNHVVYDIPVNDYSAFEDMPPPYESIVQPPSYHEATTTVKSNISSTNPTSQNTPIRTRNGGGNNDDTDDMCDNMVPVPLSRRGTFSSGSVDDETVHLFATPPQSSSSSHLSS